VHAQLIPGRLIPTPPIPSPPINPGIAAAEARHRQPDPSQAKGVGLIFVPGAILCGDKTGSYRVGFSVVSPGSHL